MDNSQNYSLIDTDCIPQRDTETDFSEWFEDAPNDAEWFENLSMNADSTSCSLAEESNNLLNELYEKNKVLEQQWTETDLKYQNVVIENQNLNIQLADERHRANKYHKKLQYIQENYHIFNQIKQAYLNMKYNENIDKPMIEIKEEASQTCPGILCASCVKIKKQSELAQPATVTNSDPDIITVKKSDLGKMHETLQQLKEKIGEREKSWSYNEEKENKFIENIKQLQNHVKQLHQEIAEKQSAIESIKLIDNNMDMVQKENVLLRKVIVKLDHRQREMEKLYRPEKRMPLLNQNEKTIVQQLVKKYAHKLEHKSKRSLSIDEASLVSLVPPPSSTQCSESPTQHTSVLNTAEVPNSISKNGAGESCSGILRVPNKYMHSTLIGDHKEQAEKPLTPIADIIGSFENVCKY